MLSYPISLSNENFVVVHIFFIKSCRGYVLIDFIILVLILVKPLKKHLINVLRHDVSFNYLQTGFEYAESSLKPEV
jgi:hypothetical protein